MYKIKLKLFGAFRKYENDITWEFEFQKPMTLTELKQEIKQKLRAQHPESSDVGLVDDSAFANEEIVLSESCLLQSSATIAVLPPVCGG